MMEIQNWEYDVINRKLNVGNISEYVFDLDEIKKILSKFGSEGWELISVTNIYVNRSDAETNRVGMISKITRNDLILETYYFKRPLQTRSE